MAAIPPHKSATDDGPFDGPGQEKNLKLDQDYAYYRRAYAWRDPDGDESLKATYKFIHHFVSADGAPGAASTRGCSSGIGVLNGARGGTTVPPADKRGIHRHLAAHMRDAGMEPPELMTEDARAGAQALSPGRVMHIAARIYNTPLLIERAKLDTILSVLGPRIGLDAPVVVPERWEEAERRDLYSLTADGIAVLDIQGILVNRGFGGLDAYSGMVSYERLLDHMEQAMADDSVRGIMLRIESPGGEAEGLPSLAERVSAMAREKPVWTAVDDYAYSAAYWLASATNRIYVSETGGVGSIGVMAEHADTSEMQRQKGVKITTIYAGARKNDFSPNEPLTSEAHQRLQRRVDEVYELFVDQVSHGRMLSKTAVRATEADIFYGRDAIQRGLADRKGTFREAMEAMRAMLARRERDDLPGVITASKTEDRGPSKSAMEYRHFGATELRAETEAEPRITGHAAIFGRDSIDIGAFVERVAVGAFNKTIQEQDVHLFFNHDGNVILGRLKSGTLRLAEDELGLRFENEPPNTQTVRDLVLEPIRRGDLDQASFAFLPVRQDWTREDGKLVRTLYEVRLFHVAIVPQGAYPQTDAALRALSGDIDLFALGCISAKCQQQTPLSDEESDYLKWAIGKFRIMLPATPGKATHLAQSAAEPPAPPDTLRARLKLIRIRAN